MALFRVALLLLILFAIALAFVWAVSSTPFFNKDRLKKISKWIAIGTVALALTCIVFAMIFSFDHTV